MAASDDESGQELRGEDQLVADLLARLPTAGRKAGVVAGAGLDDCAVVRALPKTHRLLLKTDCVIEGVHFLAGTDPALVGWKALCRPLSDIGASGGKPRHALVTLILSREGPAEWALGVYKGLGRAAREHGVVVVGGDTARTPGPSVLSVCLTGSVRKDQCVTRAGGRPGDVLYVTGQLGGSFSTGKHLRFRPRVAEGRWLARQGLVRAMMDLSDGLAADLPRLARASGTGFRLFLEQLPCTPGYSQARALTDGEDYELLLAVPPQLAVDLERRWQRRFSSLPLTAIGELAAPGIQAGLGHLSGYDHFASEPGETPPVQPPNYGL